MEITNSRDLFEWFAALLARKDAGDPTWDADMRLPVERFFFAAYEREEKGTRPGGFGIHAERWFAETGMFVLAGLLPDEVLDEPDYERFRERTWAATSAEILSRHLEEGISCHERLELAHQVGHLPTDREGCRKARRLILKAGDKMSWTESMLPAFPQPSQDFNPRIDLQELEPTLQWTMFHALDGTVPWSPAAIRHQAEWADAVMRLEKEARKDGAQVSFANLWIQGADVGAVVERVVSPRVV